jgi:hypothetical protein
VDIKVKMKIGKRVEVLEYQKVKLKPFEEPWFRFEAQDDKGKKCVYLPVDWITGVEVIPDCPHEEHEQ